MTDKQCIALAKRVEFWQKRLAPLGVGHARIQRVTVCDETPSEGKADATISVNQHYDLVWFYFTHEFLDAADQRRIDTVIVHEWLHFVFRDSDEAVRQVEKWMPEATYSDWFDRIEHEQEGIIDRLAHFIVDLYYASKA